MYSTMDAQLRHVTRIFAFSSMPTTIAMAQAIPDGLLCGSGFPGRVSPTPSKSASPCAENARRVSVPRGKHFPGIDINFLDDDTPDAKASHRCIPHLLHVHVIDDVAGLQGID